MRLPLPRLHCKWLAGPAEPLEQHVCLCHLNSFVRDSVVSCSSPESVYSVSDQSSEVSIGSSLDTQPLEISSTSIPVSLMSVSIPSQYQLFAVQNANSKAQSLLQLLCFALWPLAKSYFFQVYSHHQWLYFPLPPSFTVRHQPLCFHRCTTQPPTFPPMLELPHFGLT